MSIPTLFKNRTRTLSSSDTVAAGTFRESDPADAVRRHTDKAYGGAPVLFLS